MVDCVCIIAISRSIHGVAVLKLTRTEGLSAGSTYCWTMLATL